MYSHKDIRTALDPDIEIGGWAVRSIRKLAAAAALVDIVLNYGSPYHGESGSHEAGKDSLKRGEIESGASQSGIDEVIADGDLGNKV